MLGGKSTVDREILLRQSLCLLLRHRKDVRPLGTVLLKCAVIWVCFIPVAIANGLLREQYLVPLLGQQRALMLSGCTGAALFLGLVFLTVPWIGTLKLRQFRLIGIVWFSMTVTFEFLFGRMVMHRSWWDLVQAYNVLTGNLWLLVLAVIAISPALAARVRGLVHE